jgi:hypothetical protein
MPAAIRHQQFVQIQPAPVQGVDIGDGLHAAPPHGRPLLGRRVEVHARGVIGRYVAWPADRRQLLHHEVGRAEVFVGAVQPAHRRNGDRGVLQPVHHKHLPAQVVIREDVDL